MDVADIPTRTTGRWTAAFQVIICCGQLPTQTAIAAAILAFGVPADVNGQVPLAFFASVTLLDTVVVIALMGLFLKDGGESPLQVWFGPRERPHGPYNLPRETSLGLIFTPVVLVGAGLVAAALRILVPRLHNVPVSPFDAYFDTPGRAHLFTVVAMVAGGVREELQRGFLLHRFRHQLGGVRLGLALYSVAFGAFHYTQGWDVAIITGLLGLFWGYLYIRRGSVAASMVSHAGFNGTQVLQELVLKLAR
jgi:membrane protease YdiL (CAAX protease family)